MNMAESLEWKIMRLESKIEDQQEAIQRVRDLHRPVTLGEAGVFCEHCDQDHPCITIKALDGEQK